MRRCRCNAPAAPGHFLCADCLAVLAERTTYDVSTPALCIDCGQAARDGRPTLKRNHGHCDQCASRRRRAARAAASESAPVEPVPAPVDPARLQRQREGIRRALEEDRQRDRAERLAVHVQAHGSLSRRDAAAFLGVGERTLARLVPLAVERGWLRTQRGQHGGIHPGPVATTHPPDAARDN